MAAKPHLVAVDTNILLDLANKEDLVIDALATIRRRIRPLRLVGTPTVLHELANLIDRGDSEEIRRAALIAARRFQRVWKFEPAVLTAVNHGIAERIGSNLRERGLLPPEEVHDGLIIAEAALLGCAILLTSDDHLRGMDFRMAALQLKSYDVDMPVIATPREIVMKFF